jgi:polyhydroxyalkanoate synthesis regulator phasin
MPGDERIRKYIEAGSVLGVVTRAKADDIVRELVSAGDIQRESAQEWVDNLVDRSRKTSEHLIETVRREVATQLSKIDAKALESVAKEISDLLKRSADAGRAAAKDAGSSARKEAVKARKAGQEAAAKGREAAEHVIPRMGKKKSAKKASAAKKSAAKKAPAKKAPAKKAAKKAAS